MSTSLAGIEPRFSADNPLVEVGWLAGPESYLVWLINHSWEPSAVTLLPDCYQLTDAETGAAAKGQTVLPAKGVRILTARPSRAGAEARPEASGRATL